MSRLEWISLRPRSMNFRFRPAGLSSRLTPEGSAAPGHANRKVFTGNFESSGTPVPFSVRTAEQYPQKEDPNYREIQEVVTRRHSERAGSRGCLGAVPARTPTTGRILRIRTEERLGSLISAGGVVWAVNEATKGLADLWKFSVLPPGPLEVCAIGILIWLHAKWRRSLKID